MVSSFRNQVKELIVTHPEDTFIINDIARQLPKNIKKHSLQVLISKELKNEGYVKKIGQKGLYSEYKILKRDIDKTPKKTVKKIVKIKKIVKTRPSDEISLLQVGKAMVLKIETLKQKIRDVSSAYSDLQAEYNKQVAASKQAIRERDKKNTELLDDIAKLRETIKKLNEKLEHGGTTFKLSELLKD